MKKSLVLFFIVCLSTVIYATPITQFDGSVPESLSFRLEVPVTIATGSEFYDSEGEKYDTGNDYNFKRIDFRLWLGLIDVMALGVEVPYWSRTRDGVDGERTGSGMGDISIFWRVYVKYIGAEMFWTIPSGSSIIKDVQPADEYGTGGTLYTPYGGTHNFGFTGYFSYSLFKAYLSYVITIGRDFQDTWETVNPGDSFRWGIQVSKRFAMFRVGVQVEQFTTGNNKVEGDEIEGTNSSRMDIVPFVMYEMDTIKAYGGITIIQKGDWVQALPEVKLALVLDNLGGD